MAKYRRYRKFYKKAARWSANIQRINDSQSAGPGEARYSNAITIAQNPSQNPVGVSQTYTVKNVEVSASLESLNSNYVNGVEYYIIYVPQGYAIDTDLPFKHPEWIMAYKYIGDPTNSINQTSITSQAQPPKVKSRLSRKLQSGDSIIFFYTFLNTSDNVVNVYTKGLIRWWTKAN